MYIYIYVYIYGRTHCNPYLNIELYIHIVCVCACVCVKPEFGNSTCMRAYYCFIFWCKLMPVWGTPFQIF